MVKSSDRTMSEGLVAQPTTSKSRSSLRGGDEKHHHHDTTASAETKGIPTSVVVAAEPGNGHGGGAVEEEFSEGSAVPSLDPSDEDGGSRRAMMRRRGCFFLTMALAVGLLLLALGISRSGLLYEDLRLEGMAAMRATMPHWNGIEEVVLRHIIPRLNDTMTSSLQYLSQENKRPGYGLAQQGARAKYPVVMIPGFVTSGLEVWAGHECAHKFFRQRLWTAVTGARSFLMDTDCWRQHMMLDPLTGSDPDQIRVRAAQGFEAADYFMANYWVWGKLITNLADLGYDPSTMSMEAYDWRLAFPLLEERDGYLTKLKYKIESLRKTTRKKVVVSTHSMGALVVHYFFAWVTTSELNGGGGGGRNWVDENIHAYVNIAGSHLGVPKAASALLSGEMSDTVFLGPIGDLAEKFFGRRARRDLWSSWGSLWSMLPKGGNAIWGPGTDMCNGKTAKDDPLCPESGFSPLLAMTDAAERTAMNDRGMVGDFDNGMPWNKSVTAFLARDKHYVDDTIDFLLSYGAGLGPTTAASRLYSFKGDEKPSRRTWHDPTRTPLPFAPNMRIYCLYGTGLDTERAYYYQRNREDVASEQSANVTDPPVIHDPTIENPEQKVRYGIRYSDGDGSVPLLSLGYMCVDAWRRLDSGLNPSGTKIITREYMHRSEFTVDDPLRGGPGSADHVDILGNIQMTEDFLRVVTDFNMNDFEDRIVSNIQSISEQINSHPGGGIKTRQWLTTVSAAIHDIYDYL